MVNSREEESHLIRVLSVITQNRNGAILRGQCITESGEIVDTHKQIVARLHGRGVAVPVLAGQWWKVKGKVKKNSFINSDGFQMVEDQMEVLPGDAILKLPSGAHIVDYLKRNPRFKGVGPATADKFDLYDSKMQFCADSSGQILFWCLQQGWPATEKAHCFELNANDVPRISDPDAQPCSKAQSLKTAV